jgi:nitroimidazol reductase NimA-like FMN-containing flavoprotein (pyridoxamine 5'-phosphate oxidase superfamily)
MALPTTAEVSPRPNLTADECRAVLERVAFAHLAFTRNSHVEALPIRFAFVEGWLYFRANSVLRAAIAQNAWVVVTITDTLDPTCVASVIARGACYATDHTGSASGDAAALRGIMRLRDPAPVAPRTSRAQRTSIVFRMHVDQLRGSRTIGLSPADRLVDSPHPGQMRHSHTSPGLREPEPTRIP